MGFVTENGRVNSVSYPAEWLKKVVNEAGPDHI